MARKQNAGLLVGSPSFADTVRGPKGKGSNGADTVSRSRSQPKMEDNLFTSPKGPYTLKEVEIIE